MPAAETVITIVLKYVWVPFVALIGKMLLDERKSNKDKIEELSQKVQSCVCEAEVRLLIKEYLEPFHDTQEEIKEAVKAIAENVTQLRIDVAAGNAVRGALNDRRD